MEVDYDWRRVRARGFESQAARTSFTSLEALTEAMHEVGSHDLQNLVVPDWPVEHPFDATGRRNAHRLQQFGQLTQCLIKTT